MGHPVTKQAGERLLAGIVEVILAAEEDHLVLSPRVADRLGDLVGKIGRQLDAADFRTDTAGDGNDLNLAHWILLKD